MSTLERDGYNYRYEYKYETYARGLPVVTCSECGTRMPVTQTLEMPWWKEESKRRVCGMCISMGLQNMAHQVNKAQRLVEDMWEEQAGLIRRAKKEIRNQIEVEAAFFRAIHD